jgi:hypothetical protein
MLANSTHRPNALHDSADENKVQEMHQIINNIEKMLDAEKDMEVRKMNTRRLKTLVEELESYERKGLYESEQQN